jgi:hypothetical protein
MKNRVWFLNIAQKLFSAVRSYRIFIFSALLSMPNLSTVLPICLISVLFFLEIIREECLWQISNQQAPRSTEYIRHSLLTYCIWDSVVGIETTLYRGRSGVIFLIESRGILGITQILSPVVTPAVVKLTTPLHLVPRLRMNGSIPLLPTFRARTGTSFNFTR